MDLSPEQPPAPEAVTRPVPSAPRDALTESRLQKLIDAPEPIVAWTRGWVSRDIQLHDLFAARTLDYGVLTESSLYLVSIGFFSRRPRRCVYAARLADISVTRESVPRGRRLRIVGGDGTALLIETRATDRARFFAATVVARNRAARNRAANG
jgi:hypothetical protein